MAESKDKEEMLEALRQKVPSFSVPITDVFEDNSLSIGRTPMVRLNRVVQGLKAHVFVKVEGRNPAYSIKCRVGAALIWDAERRGALKPGMEVVEPTSGNTGIALAYVCAARGYGLTLTMPDSMSIERRRVLAGFGAKLVLTPGAHGMNGAVAEAEKIVASDPSKYFMPQQFKNPANPAIHEVTTGPEIWAAMKGHVDVLVAGVGTGGTLISFALCFLKKHNAKLIRVAVEPASSPLLTQKRAGLPLKPGPHKIQGIGANFIPAVMDLSLVDRVEPISNEDAVITARKLATQEGILCGISSGAAAAAALHLASLPEYEGKNIVAILPDSGERYLSSALFDGVA